MKEVFKGLMGALFFFYLQHFRRSFSNSFWAILDIKTVFFSTEV